MPAGSDTTLHPVEDPDIAAFEAEFGRGPSRVGKVWSALWPKLLAVGLFFGGWQVVVWTGWKPEYALPSPFTVLRPVLAGQEHALGRDPDHAAAGRAAATRSRS